MTVLNSPTGTYHVDPQALDAIWSATPGVTSLLFNSGQALSIDMPIADVIAALNEQVRPRRNRDN